MAKIEAGNAGFNEAIMMDASGYVAECTGDNIFIVKDGEMFTPMEGRLKGITLGAVMEPGRASGYGAETYRNQQGGSPYSRQSLEVGLSCRSSEPRILCIDKRTRCMSRPMSGP